MIYYVAFVMELATRKVVNADITPYPGGEWLLQIGRNLTDAISGFLRGKRFRVIDRDALYFSAFLGLLRQSGIQPVRTPPGEPKCNAHLERFNGSFKWEAADRLIFFGRSQLQRVIDEYLVRYNRERNHQSLNGRLIESGEEIGRVEGVSGTGNV